MLLSSFTPNWQKVPPHLYLWSPTLSQKLKTCLFKLHGTFNAKPLPCSPCSDLQEHPEQERSYTSNVFCVCAILFTIIPKFGHSVFKSCWKYGFHVVSILHLFISVLCIEKELGGKKAPTTIFSYLEILPLFTFLKTILLRYYHEIHPL